jgi:hypothetical protein
MDSTDQELMAAARSLPEQIAAPMLIALERSGFRIGACAYETELAVCPLVAAARTGGRMA